MSASADFSPRKALPADFPADGILFVPVSKGNVAKGGLPSAGSFNSVLLQAFTSQELAHEVGTTLHGEDAQVFAVDTALCEATDFWFDGSNPDRMAVWGSIPAEAATLVEEPSAAPGM